MLSIYELGAFQIRHLGWALRLTTANPQASPQASSRLDTTSHAQSLASPVLPCDQGLLDLPTLLARYSFMVFYFLNHE